MNTISRRDFLRASSLTLVGTLAAACTTPPASAPAAPVAGEPTAAPAAPAGDGRFQELPAFAEQVAQGTLPPVDERLPESPYVAECVERPGQYGGTLRWANRIGASAAMMRMLDYEHLTRWDKEWTKIIPNVAESFEVNEEATEFTFHLRKGMKWSDGSPFTAEDLRFRIEDVLLNTDLTPVVPSWLVVGDEPLAVDAPDDYTFVVRFVVPNGLFLAVMSTTQGTLFTTAPKHYVQQYMPEHNPDAQSLVDAHGSASWEEAVADIQDGTAKYTFLDRPVLSPWILTASLLEPAPRLPAVPNPYYWKVDIEGKQLPHIPDWVSITSDDYENLLLQMMNGDMDFAYAYIITDKNKPTLYQNREKGGYRFQTVISADSNTNAISLNLTHKDPIKREIYGNKDFRIALSHAINRQEIIDLVYITQGKPAQVGPREASELYNEQLTTQYTEYDPDRANEILDGILPEKDGEGFRLQPDGERLQIILAVDNAGGPRQDAMQLVAKYWNAVGVQTEVRVQERAFFYDEKAANLHDANTYSAPGGMGIDVIVQARFYFPFDGESNFAIAWVNWWSGDPSLGEEPPEPAKRQIELYKQISATGDPAEQNALMAELLQISADEFWVIGISTPPDSYLVAKNNLRNIIDNMPGSWAYPNPNPAEPYTWFYE